MATISEAMAIAVEHHERGRLQAAELIYRQILAANPHQADAWHLLGVLAHQLGRHEAAIEHIERAIALAADTAVYHGNLGMAYHALQRTAEAVACYRRALELRSKLRRCRLQYGQCLEGRGKA